MAQLQPGEVISVESVRPGDVIDDNTRGIQPGDVIDA